MKTKKSLLKTSAAAIALLHCINKVIDSKSIAETNTKTNGYFYHWKHGDIYYKKVGHGDPILLIHDLTVFSSDYEWSQIIEGLSLHYTVYALDLIGCGKSDKPEITYTNYFYVQLISDFVNDVIKEKTKVVATGLSTSFTVMANYIHKELFHNVILVNPKSIGQLKKTPDERSKMLIRLFSLPIIGKTAFYIATNRPNTEYYLTENCFYNPFNMNGSVLKAYYNAAHMNNGNGKMLLASLDAGYLNIDITNALKNTVNEIVIITGQYKENGNEIKNSYLKINPSIVSDTISESKELPQLENSEEMLEALFRY